MDLGVKNVFYDAKTAPIQRWTTMDKPVVYVGAVVAAVAVYATCTFENPLSNSLMQTRNTLLNVGQQGIMSSLLDVIPVECYQIKLVILVFISVTLGSCLYKATLGANKCIERIDNEALIPKVNQTKSFVARLEPQQYELQKMENTRKELEKLTGSEEYKRHQSKQRRSNKDKQSQSLANIKQSDIYGVGENGLNAFDDRHNLSMAIQQIDRLDDEDQVSAVSKKSKKSAVSKTSEGFGFVKHENGKLRRKSSGHKRDLD